MILVTSGSMLPFDRLFRIIDDAVDSGIITEPVFGQIGESRYEPKHFPFKRFIEKSEFDQLVQNASLVIGHAGIGVIIQTLEAGKKIIVLPRRGDLNEHVNDHQVSTAQKFEELGHVLVFSEKDLKEKLVQIETFQPKPRTPNVVSVGREVGRYLTQLV